MLDGSPKDRPALAVDCVVFGFAGGELRVLLARRARSPFAGCWALPGGFVGLREPLEGAARRVLRSATGLEALYLEQLHAFGGVDRDPRERTVSVAYYALAGADVAGGPCGLTGYRADWHAVRRLPTLAFDHGHILTTARKRLQSKVRHEPVGFGMLPARFTLTQLQRLYEAVLGRALDKRNFRKKVMSMGVLRDAGEVEQGVAHRAARLYRFDRGRYEALVREGFSFQL